MTQILKAATETADYIDLMKLPEPGQSVTKYAALTFRGSRPQLTNEGYVMLSPTAARNEKFMALFAGLVAGPALIYAGMKGSFKPTDSFPWPYRLVLNKQERIDKIINRSLIGIGIGVMGYNMVKLAKHTTANMLVFPSKPEDPGATK